MTTIQSQQMEKDAFVTETFVILAKFGDFLITVESSLDHMKRSGLEQILRQLGHHGRLRSGAAKRMFLSHRKRFDKDMGRIFRYSAVTSLYTLFETRMREFIKTFNKMYPGKPSFKKFSDQNRRNGLIKNARLWLENAPGQTKLSQPRIWNLLDDLRLIRNSLTHAHGDVSLSDNRTELIKAVNRTRKINFDLQGILRLDAEFAFEASERVYTFFVLLFRAAGFKLLLPPGCGESFVKNLSGLEPEISEGIKRYYASETINLGGHL